MEELAARTAVDFDDFYATRKLPPAADQGDVLALSADGKGIVMRPEALRLATARAAAKTSPKLATRLSKGEKRNRKRMAELSGWVRDCGYHCAGSRRPSTYATRWPNPARSPLRSLWGTTSTRNRAGRRRASWTHEPWRGSRWHVDGRHGPRHAQPLRPPPAHRRRSR